MLKLLCRLVVGDWSRSVWYVVEAPDDCWHVLESRSGSRVLTPGLFFGPVASLGNARELADRINGGRVPFYDPGHSLSGDDE